MTAATAGQDVHATAPGQDLSGLTAAAARFAAAVSFGDLDAEGLRLSKRCLIDGLGVMLAGSEQPGMAALENFIRAEGGAAQSRLLGLRGRRASATRAALWAGTAGHAMDWDDTQLAEGPGRPYGLLMHPTVPPLAAALAWMPAASPARSAWRPPWPPAFAPASAP